MGDVLIGKHGIGTFTFDALKECSSCGFRESITFPLLFCGVGAVKVFSERALCLFPIGFVAVLLRFLKCATLLEGVEIVGIPVSLGCDFGVCRSWLRSWRFEHPSNCGDGRLDCLIWSHVPDCVNVLGCRLDGWGKWSSVVRGEADSRVGFYDRGIVHAFLHFLDDRGVNTLCHRIEDGADIGGDFHVDGRSLQFAIDFQHPLCHLVEDGLQGWQGGTPARNVVFPCAGKFLARFTGLHALAQVLFGYAFLTCPAF